jgi:hypothetical protein
MGLIKQINSKNKAIRIIESCRNKTQLSVASNYVELYYKKYEDFLGYNELKRIIINKETNFI